MFVKGICYSFEEWTDDNEIVRNLLQITKKNHFNVEKIKNDFKIFLENIVGAEGDTLHDMTELSIELLNEIIIPNKQIIFNSISTNSETEKISDLEKQRKEIQKQKSEFETKIKELDKQKEKIQKQIDQEKQLIQDKKQLEERFLTKYDKETIIEWLLE